MLSDDHRGFGEAPAASLAGAPQDVLPRMSRNALSDLLRRLPPDDLEESLRRRLVPVLNLPGVALHVACGSSALAEARASGLAVVALCEVEDLLAASRGVHGGYLVDRATFGLLRIQPTHCARIGVSALQAVSALGFLAMITGSALMLPLPLVISGLAVAGGVFFMSVVALRGLCLMPGARPVAAAPDGPPLTAAELPVYSVLIPLFRETAVLGQLIAAMTSLRYPAEKLEIKLILEEQDLPMREAVSQLALDRVFEVIVVPAGQPQTKPRALNYALSFCCGELVTIYDAEDIPQPDQLLKAARHFAGAPPALACLQARLAFYNAGENWLTRQFAAEYAVLFNLMLPALAAHRLPLPLGGTSNHFRVHALRAAGGWDPFNVTEDADLGLRLCRLGFATGVLDSVTHEEASSTLGNWLHQRTRWLKGYLITWLVHMRSPWRLLKELGASGFWAAQVLTLGVFASVLLHPLCIASTLAFHLTGTHLPADASLALKLLWGVNIFVLASGYGLAMILMRRALMEIGQPVWRVILLTMPGYWCLMSAAAWMALWQFALRPFHWNKTVHGLSRHVPPVSLLP